MVILPTQAQIDAVSERATRDVVLARARLVLLGLIPEDNRKKQPKISYLTLFLAATAARVQLWERAGHLPRLNPSIPTSATLDDWTRQSARFALDSLSKEERASKRACEIEVLRLAKVLVSMWFTSMAHVPLVDNVDADFELVTPADYQQEPAQDKLQDVSNVEDELLRELAELLYAISAESTKKEGAA